MTTTLNASTAGAGGFIATSDNSGILALQTAGTTALSIDASQNITTTNKFAKASMPTGSVLQVVQGNYSSSMTTSSTSFVDTGITATITPLFSTSSILVIVNLNGGASSAVAYKLLRGSTALSLSAVGSGLNGTFGAFLSSANLISAAGFNYLDSPATTSATVYKIQLAVDTGTASINRRTTDTYFGFTSNIILMEIAA